MSVSHFAPINRKLENWHLTFLDSREPHRELWTPSESIPVDLHVKTPNFVAEVNMFTAWWKYFFLISIAIPFLLFLNISTLKVLNKSRSGHFDWHLNSLPTFWLSLPESWKKATVQSTTHHTLQKLLFKNPVGDVTGHPFVFTYNPCSRTVSTTSWQSLAYARHQLIRRERH